MRLVFAHDHRFKMDKEGRYYTSGAFNNMVWKRYLKYFDHISVVARLDKNIIDQGNSYNSFDLPETSFTPLPPLNGLVAQFKNKKEVYKIIEKELLYSDALVARLPSEIGNVAVRVAKNLGIPYIIEAVGCVWDALWNYGSIRAKLYAPFATLKMKRLIKDAPYVIYVTNRFLQNRYPTKGKTENISNVEIKETSEYSLKKRIERYSRKGLYTIGIIGSLNNEIKGLRVAFKALNLLYKESIDFQLNILGDGNKEPWLKLANELGIEDKVYFCGTLPGGNAVLEWLDYIDIYIQPSYQEGLPRAVIEAMSRGCPVIGSTAGGIPELINNKYVHRPGDHKKLAYLLRYLMSEVDSAIYLSEQNFNESRNYTKDKLDKKRDTIWQCFIKKI